jgi:ribosomal protein S12 methylthiotransferase accessory factor
MSVRVAPLARAAGITRLANITGLDRIGIPVWSAIRPAARTLAVASGKGLTHDAARVSALMEAIETFHGEEARFDTLRASYAELAEQHAVVQAADLPLIPYARFDPRRVFDWTVGSDLMHDGAAVAVPVETVQLPHASLRPATFHRSSNGLASGAVRVEAVLAALLEVVERDAVACHLTRARRLGQGMPRVRLDTTTHMPLVQDLLARLTDARVRPVVYDCTADTGIPVFFAYLWDQTRRHVGIYYGSGAHLDPEIALLRALTEAAQSRAVYIAGNRDDISRREMAAIRAQDSPEQIAALEAQPESVDVSPTRSSAAATFEQDLRYIINQLQRAGIRNVVAFDLTQPAFRGALSVVRVVVPGLAGSGVESGHSSRRSEAFAARVAA